MKTLIVGLGNPILTDDGIGVKAALALEQILENRPPARDDNWLVQENIDSASYNPQSDIHVIEASVGGLRLMELMIGYDRVVIIDALTVRDGAGPGTIHRLTLDDLRAMSPTQHSASAHDTTLVNALDSGQQLGFHLPDEVIIYAIEVENVTDFNEEPTTAVSAAIPHVVTAVLQELALPTGQTV